jgi:hypothetical protein
MPSTYTRISSNVLSSSAASVTFSSIPSTYTDLVLRVSTRTTSVDVDGSAVRVNFNGDNSSVYSTTILGGSGSAASSATSADTYGWFSYNGMASAGNTANTFASGELYIGSYTASQNKQMSSFYVSENNATAANMNSNALLWRNTAAISSIVLSVGSASFVAGSSFYLYGIKNS